MNEIPIRAYGVAVVVVREGGDERRFLLLRRTRPPVGAGVSALYSADLCEQFYEINRDSIWMAPVFVAFVDSESNVVINEEHDAYRWCTAVEGVAALTFPGTAQILGAVDRHFVVHEPSPLLRIEF